VSKEDLGSRAAFFDAKPGHPSQRLMTVEETNPVTLASLTQHRCNH